MRRSSRSNPVSLFSFQDIITGLSGIMIFFVLIMIVDLVMRRETPTPEISPIQDQTETATALSAEIQSLESELAQLKATLSKKRLAIASAASDEEINSLQAQLNDREEEVLALITKVDALQMQLEKARDANAKSKRILAEMENTRRQLETQLSALKQKQNGITLIPERGVSKLPIYVLCESSGIRIATPLDKEYKEYEFNTFEQTTGLYSTLKGLNRSTHNIVVLVRPSGVYNMENVLTIVRGLGFTYGRDILEENMDVNFGRGQQ